MKKRKLALLVCAAAVTTLMATACAGKSGQDGKTASGAESRTGSAVSDAQSEAAAAPDAQSETAAAAAESAVASAVEEGGIKVVENTPLHTDAKRTPAAADSAAPESIAESVPAAMSDVESVAQEADEETSEQVALDLSWPYADHSKIHSGMATLYHARPSIAKHKTVCVNAGHGTEGGESVKTLCHPDGTPKVTGGSTAEGATEAMAVAGGMTFQDGTPERDVTVALALVVKRQLLDNGYDVLMIREGKDVQLDNIARTVLANNKADCHIALHYDSTSSDKGVFFFSVPSNESYRNMEPVASHWQDHNRLGENIVKGIEAQGFKLFEGGAMEMDLTQTSYSTVPSIDLEEGDGASDHSGMTFPGLAKGISEGLDSFFLFTK